jgi:hypothetical protein
MSDDDERRRGDLVSEVDPDPHQSGEGTGQSELGGRQVPASGDPTAGGKRGEIGEAPSIAADEPDLEPGYPVGGGGGGGGEGEDSLSPLCPDA